MWSLFPILAQGINPYATPQTSITQWISNLIPLSTLSSLVGQIMPAFLAVGVMIVGFGTIIAVQKAQDPGTGKLAIAKAVVLIAAMGCSIWWLELLQSMVNGVVAVIGASSPEIQQLSVTDPTTGGATLNFGQIFQKLSQFLVGNTNALAANPGLNIGAWSDYIMRLVLIMLISLVAGFTTFVMDVMLIIQKLIMILSRPFVPVFFGCLALDATRSNAYNFFKQIIGVMAWPIGWALVNVGTVAALQNLQPPNWLGDLGGLIMSLTTLAVVCLWMIVGTISAPKFISWCLTTGGNFAAGMVGQVSSSGMQMIKDGASAGGKIGGATIGGMLGGASGAALGAQLGGAGAGVAMTPLGGMQQSIDGGTKSSPTAPSERSVAAADAAVAAIVLKNKGSK
jgi:hypothetical protein